MSKNESRKSRESRTKNQEPRAAKLITHNSVFKTARKWLERSRWNKFLAILFMSLTVTVGTMYGIALWYIASSNDKPLRLGASFIPAYAQSLGLNAEDTMDALINDAGVRRFRLVSYWDQLEPSPGQYDFTLLDWQFAKAEAADAKITLSIGLRQPRWPECHTPTWVAGQPVSRWQPQLEKFIVQVVSRYKDSPSLDSYQLENEYFLRGFGYCTNFDRQRLIDEYNLVKKHDPTHTLIVARSNNALGLPIGEPTPDQYGISIYKRVWDAGVTKRYLEYPFPAWYYGFVAGLQKIVTGRDMIIHELQAEAWAPNNKKLNEISLTEQNKSLNSVRLKNRIEFGKGTGMRTIDLWGAEYWYWRKVHLNDPSLWNVAKETFRQQK